MNDIKMYMDKNMNKAVCQNGDLLPYNQFCATKDLYNSIICLQLAYKI